MLFLLAFGRLFQPGGMLSIPTPEPQTPIVLFNPIVIEHIVKQPRLDTAAVFALLTGWHILNKELVVQFPRRQL